MPTPLIQRSIHVAETGRANEAGAGQAALLGAVLDSVDAPVLVVHPDGRLARCNRACEIAMGFAAGAAAGRPLTAICPSNADVAAFARHLARVGATGESGACETSWPRRAGPRQIAWSLSAIRAGGGVQYVVAAGTDITERRRLERTILDIADREQRRIGRDLHDGLGQHLTGIAFMGKVLESRLRARGESDAAAAARIVGLVNDAIEKTRELARGLLPVKSARRGLAPALRQIALDAQALFGIACWTATGVPVVVAERAVMHLCYIAREAVTNAVRHGRARQIRIELVPDGRSGRLTIRDDGSGLPARAGGDGLGLHLMRYRSRAIGGSLEIERGRPTGTVVTCRFPVGDEARLEAGA